MKKRTVRIQRLMLIALMAGSALIPACREGRSSAEAPAGEVEKTSADEPHEALVVSAVKTEKVGRRSFSMAVKATGIISFNQKKYVCISARVPGRIEEVLAFEGDRVKTGQTLVTLYSPDFLSVQQELIHLFQQQERSLKSGDEESAKLAAGLIRSSVHRIKLMGVGEEDIRKIQEGGTVSETLDVTAPFSGTLVSARAVSGEFVEMGTELFELADLDILWATVNIFEKDLALVRTGSQAEVRTQAYPEEVFPGRLVLIGDVQDEVTRTTKGRLELPNPSRKLKPGMFIDVTLIPGTTGETLAVPEQAVRQVEGKTVVFVQVPGGAFEPRAVKLGSLTGGWAEILEGLQEGEVVATEGSFSLKAEMLKKTLEGEHE
ncbi:MAG: efflux RND transporter periplasmic adaptor subunit [Candidatus Aminicenantes bacterium]|nr:efflux RND transporter periplasmic adaptor subunit [Candidatus Aminicenantes bacterium]